MHVWKSFHKIWCCEKCNALSAGGATYPGSDSFKPPDSAVIMVIIQDGVIYNAWERTNASYEPDADHILMSCLELQIFRILKE